MAAGRLWRLSRKTIPVLTPGVIAIVSSGSDCCEYDSGTVNCTLPFGKVAVAKPAGLGDGTLDPPQPERIRVEVSIRNTVSD